MEALHARLEHAAASLERVAGLPGGSSGSMPSDNPGIQLEDLDPDSIGDVLDDDDPAALDAEQRYGALSPLADTSLDAHVTDVRPLLRKRGRASL